MVIQADAINQAAPTSVILALITSHLREAPLLRLRLEPTVSNGLERPSDVMLDKLFTAPTAKIGRTLGRLSDQELLALNRQLAFVIGLG